MKTNLFILAFISGFTFCSAQQLKVEAKKIKNHEGNEVEAWVATLDQVPDDCMESYDDFMKKVFDRNPEKMNKTMMMVEKVILNELSPLRIDQRTFFTQESGGTAVAFTFSPGYDVHFGSKLYSDEFERGEKLVKSFVKFHYKDYYNKQIKQMQKAIEDKESEVTSDEKKIERNKKSMLDNNKKINNGDSDAGKLRIKNDSLEQENIGLEGDIAKDRTEIKSQQDQLIKLHDSVRKVEDF